MLLSKKKKKKKNKKRKNKTKTRISIPSTLVKRILAVSFTLSTIEVLGCHSKVYETIAMTERFGNEKRLRKTANVRHAS